MSHSLWGTLIGHRSIKNSLLSRAENHNLGSALLFVGPSGVGKTHFIWALAQSLLCQISNEGCGECPSCHRVANKSHENLLWIEPEKNQIRLEEAGAVQDFLSTKGLVEQKKIVCIDSAHLFNPQAANSLLKVLEEPPPGVHFLLTASSERQVLSTIRSRCQLVRLHPVEMEDLKMARSPIQDWQLRAARGLVGRALALAEAESQQEFELALSFWDDFFNANSDLPAELLQLPREQGEKICEYWLGFLRDGMLTQLGQAPAAELTQYPQVNERLKKGVQQLSASKIIDLYFWIEEVLRGLHSTRDNRLVWEQAWIHGRRMVNL